MREVDFHEDDYCQIEVLPLANWQFCSQEMQAINAFAEQHRAAIGWTKMYPRSENPHPLSELRIGRQELTDCLREVLPEFDRVTTGYGCQIDVCPRTTAFGHDRAVVFFAEFGHAETMAAMWLRLDVFTRDLAASALQAFRALSEKWQLLLADWGWSVLLELADSEHLSSYLQQRIEVFSGEK